MLFNSESLPLKIYAKEIKFPIPTKKQTLKYMSWDFPGGPTVKTQRLHCSGRGFDLGNPACHACGTAKQKKIIRCQLLDLRGCILYTEFQYGGVLFLCFTSMGPC